jgi:hypothetical protein
MMVRSINVIVLALLAVTSVIVVGGTALAQSSNSEVGIWKLNVAKSQISPGTGPKSATIKFETAGAGTKVTVDGVDATDGTMRHWESITHYDGKDSPITGNAPNAADTVARTRVNATTTTEVNKKGGKIMATGTAVVSSDGKTMTSTITVPNPEGQAINLVLVWDKQ